MKRCASYSPAPIGQAPRRSPIRPPAATAKPRFTMEQVQAIARQQNPTFKEFEANRERARAEVLQALAYPNPEIDLGAGVATPPAKLRKTR